jgi:hypothetical protein
MQLNKKALGLAAGILWGLSVLLMTVWAVMAEGGNTLQVLARFYLGYSVSWTGALIGLGYGFLDGFIGGWLLAWLYNKFA